MSYTEEEARDKWCPYIRISYVETLIFTNREADPDKPVLIGCIGSKCMKWEWVDGSKKKGYCKA